MAKNIQKLAELMGAQIVGSLPEVGGGAFGASRFASIHKARQLQLSEPQAETEKKCSLEVTISLSTERKLVAIAERLSTPGCPVTPMQVAAELLEEASRQVPLVSPPNQEPCQGPPTS